MRKKQKDQEQKADFQIPSRFCFFGAGAGSRKNKYPFFVGTCSRSRVSRGLANFVAAALPKAPICALKLGDRTSTTEVLRGMFEGFRRARSSSAAARQYVLGCGRFFLQAWKGAIVVGLTHFVAAVLLPKAPLYAPSS